MGIPSLAVIILMFARSPKLKLNFSRFGGILIGVYNAAVKNKCLGTNCMARGMRLKCKQERTSHNTFVEFESLLVSKRVVKFDL